MASIYKTTNLKLPQWELSDKPQMADFNDAFEKIDNYTKSALTTSDVESTISKRVLDNGEYKRYFNTEQLKGNEDFNTILEDGIYWISSNSKAEGLINAPQKIAGTLKVYNPLGPQISPSDTYSYIIQEFVAYDASAHYIRRIQKTSPINGWEYFNWRKYLIEYA